MLWNRYCELNQASVSILAWIDWYRVGEKFFHRHAMGKDAQLLFRFNGSV
jgi:hypothetical protein